MHYPILSSELFSDRRQSFRRKMKRHSVAVFYSNEAMPKSGDQHYPFRQDSSLFALSGLNQPASVLVLLSEATNTGVHELAFVLPQDPKNTTWNGKRLTTREIRLISGIQTVHSSARINKILFPLLKKAKTIYINVEDMEGDLGNSLLLNDRMGYELKREFTSPGFLSAKPILQSMLMVKHPLEIELINKAIAVTSLAFDRVLQTIRPGMREYEVEAELTYIISRHGCRHSFEPIVASGKSACTLHYIRNDGLIKANELVLIDFGAEYSCMSSDMTRTVPASGVFTKRQKQIYQSVQTILEEITQMMRPGITLSELNKATGELVDRELVKLKIVSMRDLKNQDPANPIRRKYFMHGVSHHMGYDVHDQSDRSTPLKAGMVLTCEPGLYISEESIGIRLENDILITRGRPKNLMADVPIEAEHIEEIILSGRKQEIGNRR
jgi:Xaa-Pro aminopeptidase